MTYYCLSVNQHIMGRAEAEKNKSTREDMLRKKLDVQNKALKKVLKKLKQKYNDQKDQTKEE